VIFVFGGNQSGKQGFNDTESITHPTMPFLSKGRI